MVTILKQIRNYLLIKIIWRRYQIASGFHAGPRVRLWAKNKLYIGKSFYIGRDSFIETDCIIGDFVIFGNKVAIVGRYDHHYQQIGCPISIASSIREVDYSWRGLGLITRIGDDVWVGYGSTILQGVQIGSGAIVAAGSVVTKDIEPYSIYAGNPAKKIRDRFNTIEEKEKHLNILRSKYFLK